MSFQDERYKRGEVRYNAVIGDVEDRGMGIGVDGDDALRILHAHDMLVRAGYAAGDVHAWRHPPPGYADLTRVREPAIVHDRTRCADCGIPDDARERSNELKVLPRADAPARRYDDIGLFKTLVRIARFFK